MKLLRYIPILMLIIGFVACKTQNPTTQTQTESVAVDRSKSVDIRGEKLHYIEKGSGEPLIFIHGTVGDYRVWISRMEPYSNDTHVIAYSRRYAWPNKKIFDKSADYSVRIHADDLYALIQKMGLKKVNLVGHSYGAYTALTMALDHPEAVKSMVLGEPPAISLLENASEAGKASFDTFKRKNLGSAATAFQDDDNEKGVEWFLKGVLGDGFSIDEVPPVVKQAWMDNLPEVWGAAMTDWNVTLDTDKIKSLKIPVLLLKGDLSPDWFGAVANELHRLLPLSELITIENSSHGLYFEQPEAVDKAVMEFLENH